MLNKHTKRHIKYKELTIQKEMSDERLDNKKLVIQLEM